MFVVSIVPLKLSYYSNIGEPSEPIWENIRYSSTRFCRPLEFHYLKETAHLTKSTTEKIKGAIKNLEPTIISIENQEVLIQHELIMSMIDGKVKLTGFYSLISNSGNLVGLF